MLGTARTSRCNASEKRLDDRSRNRERERFDELAFVPDEDSAMMRRECGHDVLTFQFAADEILGPVELDATMGIHFADERHPALGDRNRLVTTGIDIGIEREAVREMAGSRRRPRRWSSKWIVSALLHEY